MARAGSGKAAASAATLIMVGSAPRPAAATTVFPEEFTCPVGGEVFEDYVVGSYSSFGQRPDGRAYGTLPIPPLVECPGNGFVLFEDEFTPEEITRLTPLVASAEYQAMRETETSHHRAWRLMQALDRDPPRLAGTLLVASWETDDDTERKARYQRLFVDAAAAIQPTDKAWFYFNLRAANALRELARFENAAALLSAVHESELWPEDDDEQEGARLLLTGLSALISEGNPHPEPTNLTPPQVAAERCIEMAASLSPAERAACAEPQYQEAIAQREDYLA